MTYGILNKHNERAAVWVALGWISGNDRTVDLAGYLSFPPKEDALFDELSTQILRSVAANVKIPKVPDEKTPP